MNCCCAIHNALSIIFLTVLGPAVDWILSGKYSTSQTNQVVFGRVKLKSPSALCLLGGVPRTFSINLLKTFAYPCLEDQLVFVKYNRSTRMLFFALGLVLRLNDHREEYADKYLKKHSSYVLIEKQETKSPTDEGSPVFEHHPNTPLINYVPLLENCSTLLPKFKLRVVMETAGQHIHRNTKSPRPSSRATPQGATKTSNSNKKKRHASKTKTPKDSTRWIEVAIKIFSLNRGRVNFDSEDRRTSSRWPDTSSNSFFPQNTDWIFFKE